MIKIPGLFGVKYNMIGLDLGSSYVKLMEISGDSYKNAKVLKYSILPIPKEFMGENGKVEKIEEVAAIVKQAWKLLNTNVKNVAMALPGISTTSKKLSMENMTSVDEMMLNVETEIGKHLPNGVAVTDMSIDYFKIGSNIDFENESNILMVAAKKDTIDERIAIVEMAGLTPLIMEVEEYSYQNLLRFKYGESFLNGINVLVDCSGYAIRLMVYKNGDFFYSREAHFGGHSLTQNISSNYAMDINDAEEVKKKSTRTTKSIDNESFKMAVNEFLSSFVSEFLGVFSYFTSATSITEIESLIFVGGAANIEGLIKAVEMGLMDYPEITIKNPVTILNPLEDIEKHTKIDLSGLSKDLVGLSLVTSLALRKMLRDY